MNNNYSKLILDGDKAYDKKNWQTAIDLYQNAINSGDSNGYARLGYYYWEILKDYDKAKKCFDVAIQKGNIVVHRYMSYYYDKLNDTKNSLLHLEKAADLGEDKSQLLLGICYFEEEKISPNYKKAIYWLDKAIQSNPSNQEAYFYRGLCYLNGLKQYDKAINDFNKAIQFEPNALTYYNRGVCYRSLNQYEKAIEDFTKSIQRYPKDADVYVSRGDSYFALKDYNRAVKDFNKAIALGSEDSNIFLSYYMLGTIYYYKLKQYRKSIKNCTKAIEIFSTLKKNSQCPDFPNNEDMEMLAECYAVRGTCYNKIDQFENAVEDYKKAAQFNPREKEYQENLEKIKNNLKNISRYDNYCERCKTVTNSRTAHTQKFFYTRFAPLTSLF